MRQYLIVFCTISLILFFGNLSTATEIQDGFMRYKWGENVTQYEGLTKMYTKGDITYYSNPGESYTLDDMTIHDVIFGFYKESLFAVYVGIDSLEKYDKIQKYMQANYGLPDHKTVGKEHLTLKWKYQDIAIKLKVNKNKEKMKLAFYYTVLSRDLKKNQLNEIDNTSFEFVPIDKDKRPETFQLLRF